MPTTANLGVFSASIIASTNQMIAFVIQNLLRSQYRFLVRGAAFWYRLVIVSDICGGQPITFSHQIPSFQRELARGPLTDKPEAKLPSEAF